jgi:hypothetical protein
MLAGLDPFSFLVVSIAGWMNQRQHRVIEYLIEENRVLREQIGNRRMRFSDSQRRRLAAKAKMLGRQLLAQVATIVTPETLLAWHRKLIAETRSQPAGFRSDHRRFVYIADAPSEGCAVRRCPKAVDSAAFSQNADETEVPATVFIHTSPTARSQRTNQRADRRGR